MAEEYSFLAHHVFDQFLGDLVASRPELEGLIKNQIRIIKTDPYSGSTMQGAPPPLQGRIMKRLVGGPRGHRLFYIVFPERKLVLGVFITPDARKDVDYREFPWEYFTEAAKDFNDKKKEKFRLVE